MDTYNNSSVTFITYGIIAVMVIISLVAEWKIYQKAGQPGWTAIVPIYNLYVLQKIVGRPGWFVLLYFIPLANIAVVLLNGIDLAKVFGKDTTFGILGLWLFSLVGYLILGFGNAVYLGVPNRSAPQTPPPTPPAPPA